MAHVLHDLHLGAHAVAHLFAQRLIVHERIGGVDQRKAGSSSRSLGIGAPLGHGRLNGRAIQRQHATRHFFVAGRNEFGGNLGGHAQHHEQVHPVLHRRGHGVDKVLLASARRLPHLSKAVPHIVGVNEPGDIAHPRTQQVGPSARHPSGECAAPVVAHQIYWLANGLKLADEP